MFTLILNESTDRQLYSCLKDEYWYDAVKSIPTEILVPFNDILKLRNIPLLSRPDYRKCVMYFLDFRAKYQLPAERSIQVRLFSEKLRSKGQTEVQVQQAAAAVSLFFAPQQQPASSTRDGGVLNAVVRGGPEKTLVQGPPAQPAPVKDAGMVNARPGLSTSDGHCKRRQGRYDDWRCLKKSGYPAWDTIISLLADEIKTRHYSRKTLQHHADWGMQHAT